MAMAPGLSELKKHFHNAPRHVLKMDSMGFVIRSQLWIFYRTGIPWKSQSPHWHSATDETQRECTENTAKTQTYLEEQLVGSQLWFRLSNLLREEEREASEALLDEGAIGTGHGASLSSVLSMPAGKEEHNSPRGSTMPCPGARRTQHHLLPIHTWHWAASDSQAAWAANQCCLRRMHRKEPQQMQTYLELWWDLVSLCLLQLRRKEERDASEGLRTSEFRAFSMSGT